MASGTRALYQEYAIEEYSVRSEPYYRTVSDEIELFEAAYYQQLPVLLKGPNRVWQDPLH